MLDKRFQQILGRLWSWRTLPAYENFEQALANTGGYEDRDIIQVVCRKTEALRRELSENSDLATIGDRQTVQNMFVLSHVWAGEPLNVLDIGGACGATYFVLNHLLPGKIGSWSVLETPGMAAEGRRVFQDIRLTFIEDIDREVTRRCDFDLLLASGVLQYLPNPSGALDAWLEMGTPFIYLTRTAVGIDIDKPIITKQVTDLASHGPGPLPEGLLNLKISHPLTIIPYETIISSLSRRYKTEFVFKEEEDKSMWVGSRLIKISTMGFLLRIRKGG